jgi:hypothetical protein
VSQRSADAARLQEERLHRSPNPKPILLNVGITGHRASALTAPLVQNLEPIVDEVFRQLREAALKIQEEEVEFCSLTPAQLRLHTPLASGADQIAAKSAHSSGYLVRAVLPFEPDEYRNDFAPGEELDEFERALEAADEIVALPGERSDAEGAYVLVGESLIEAADILVAIWDGEEGRGPGGTAHVVELALQSSVPVIHIDINRGSDEVRMRALVGGDATKPIDASLRDTDSYSGLLRDALKLSPTALTTFDP